MLKDTITSRNPIHGLQLHSSATPNITMSRVHHGMDLFDKVKILEIREYTVLMQAQNSLVLAECGGTIHLHSEHIPYPIQGQMVDEDLSKSIFVLGELSYLVEGWKERHQVCVQPEEPVYFTLQKMGCLVRANLLDLDITGLGASADRAIADLLDNDTDYGVSMDITLSPDISINHLQGTVCYAHDLNRKATRLGIRTRPTSAQTTQLAHYIEERRDKIIVELKDSYAHAIAPAPVQNLYF